MNFPYLIQNLLENIDLLLVEIENLSIKKQNYYQLNLHIKNQKQKILKIYWI
jgi:hypothetical protein